MVFRTELDKDVKNTWPLFNSPTRAGSYPTEILRLSLTYDLGLRSFLSRISWSNTFSPNRLLTQPLRDGLFAPHHRVHSMTRTSAVVEYVKCRAAEIVGEGNVCNELHVITKGKFIYFVAGARVLAVLGCLPNDEREFFPLDAGSIFLN